jgi:hypothetical protein
MALEENNSRLYQELVVQYYGLKAKRKACLEQINALEAKLQVLAEQLRDINDILCKHGNYIYEHFEEEKPIVKSEKSEDELIDCESTKCENCVNHNECEYEPYPTDKER